MIAAIYARKSTEQHGVSDDQRSVARQVEHARAFVERKGWTVGEGLVFVDDGISGAEFAARPGFLQLMNALKPRPPFQILVMSEVSRLGREQIETAWALKQLSTAGVRTFSYLDDRELRMESATDKFLLSAVNFAAELEREKARQRVYDAMQRKARAGHVTGGACFGYRNIEVVGADGRRSHVARVVEPDQAAVITRIFRLCAAGHGLKAIAKTLNDEGAPSPRAQRGRSQTWAPSSVREVLFRSSYRGQVVWNASRKRDQWGRQHQVGRPEAEWIHVAAPDLRIVDDELWQAAHARLTAARALYLRGTSGQTFGRPALGNPSRYLLTHLAACKCCGSGLQIRSRDHGSQRAKFYVCAGYHERGRTVCRNGSLVPMADGDAIVIEALLDEVLAEDMIAEAVGGALALVAGADVGPRLELVEAELAKVERERSRLVAAIAAGGELGSLVDAVKEREARRAALDAERAALTSQRRRHSADLSRVRGELQELAGEWRDVLARKPEHARPVVAQLLEGRAAFEPIGPMRWRVTGRATLAGLFSRELGLPTVWRPQTDSTALGGVSWLRRSPSRWSDGEAGAASLQGRGGRARPG